jgi:CBS domain-containing protein
MRARDVMTTDVVTVSPETSVRDAARLMLGKRISGLPVVDAAGQLVGVISEGDLMRRAELITERRPWWEALASSPEEKAHDYTKAHGMQVRDVMTKDIVTIDEHEPLDRIAMLFEGKGIKRAPVVADGKVIGIVSRANLLQGLAAGKITEAGPDDNEIRAAILQAAREDAGVRTSLVDVTVHSGIVYLWGNVGSDAERDAVRVAAETAEGVREVRDHLRILPPSVFVWKPE